MSTTLTIFSLMLSIAGASVLVGWWLRSRRDPFDSNAPASLEAKPVGAQIARRIVEHSELINQISSEISGNDTASSEAVSEAVSKLIEANEKIKNELATSEDELSRTAQLIAMQLVQGSTDPLTMLGNRQAFDKEMASRWSEFERQGRGFSLMMIDVDHFKRFNDRHGHRAGDEVLRGMGRVLKQTTREMDVVTRYGGEEFAVIMPGTDLQASKQAAERIRKAIAVATFQYDKTEYRVTASVGLAMITDGEDCEAVIQRADKALYASKESGRNCGHWHDGKEIQRITPRDENSTPHSADAMAENRKEETKPASARRDKPATLRTPADSRPSAGLDGWSDRITGLCNKSAFCREIQRRVAEWRRGGSTLSIILVEIDDFPQIARDFGEEAAQLVLRSTTQFLTASVRDMDLAARYDEAVFGLMLPAAKLADASLVAGRMRIAIADSEIAMGERSLRFTISSGVAEVVEGDDGETFLQRADDALAAAVRKGTNHGYNHNGLHPEPAMPLGKNA